jgi:CheY-like chemotaxis protein
MSETSNAPSATHPVHPDIEKCFGTAIRKWRENLHLSQEQLARRAGMHRTYICDVERGARNISLKNIQKLADALAVPLLTLFADLTPKTSAVFARSDEMVDILIIEDNTHDTELTVENFKNWNINNRFFIVRDGQSALNFLFNIGEFSHRLPTDQPQVILLDVNLPKMDGLEVLRRIKADPRTHSIPIVVLTNSQNERDMMECKRLGVEDYILKPITFHSFSEVNLRLNLQWALFKPMVSATI